MTPSPLLLIAAFCGLAVSALPLWLGAEWWIAPSAMWGVLGSAALFDVLVLWQSRPSVQARPPDSVGVGDRFAVPLVLAMARGGLSAELRGETEGPVSNVSDLRLHALRGETSVTLEFDAPRRGEAKLRAVWSRLRGPLHLVLRVDRHPIEAVVAVIPNAERVRALALAHFGAQPMGGTHLQRRIGDGGELDSLEQYQPGMDLRKIDWKSSARHQRLQVRRFRVEQNQRVVLCVDTGRLMADPIEGVERLDHAIHSTLLLAQVALRAGDQVGVFAYDNEVHAWAPPTGGKRQLVRLRRTLATLEARPEETNHVIGVHRLLSRLKRRSMVVVFTEFTDGTTAELMLEYLGHLARRHLVVFVALEDPAIEAPAAKRPEAAHDLCAAVVAGEIREGRARVLRRLRRMGVDVITGPPGPAALKLLARYVHIKRRGLIG